jgi:hypothetical protein
MLRVTEVNGRVRFGVRVQPRAAKSSVLGILGDALKVRVAAAPVDGAANEELLKFLTKIFAVGVRDVRIVAGETSRSKIVEIDGITERAVRNLAEGTTR